MENHKIERFIKLIYDLAFEECKTVDEMIKCRRDIDFKIIEILLHNFNFNDLKEAYKIIDAKKMSFYHAVEEYDKGVFKRLMESEYSTEIKTEQVN